MQIGHLGWRKICSSKNALFYLKFQDTRVAVRRQVLVLLLEPLAIGNLPLHAMTQPSDSALFLDARHHLTLHPRCFPTPNFDFLQAPAFAS